MRIVALSQSAGISLYHDDEHRLVRALHQPTRMFRLEGRYQQVVVALWGAAWEPAWIERALHAAQEGHHPWLCQRCLRHALCRECGAPESRAPGADAIDDDGRSRHHPLLPGQPSCTTPGCPRHRS